MCRVRLRLKRRRHLRSKEEFDVTTSPLSTLSLERKAWMFCKIRYQMMSARDVSKVADV